MLRYNPKNAESQVVQKTLFNEKKTIIENCLFGVDINPNSVKICRLRLWIELLKNAYYKNTNELETLPNIDINIKTGNSLLSRFKLDTDLKTALKKTKISIAEYKNAFNKYQNAQNKEQKWELEHFIDKIKYNFRTEISGNSKEVKELQKLKYEYYLKYESPQLFSETLTPEQEKYKKQLETAIEKIETEIEAINSNKIYENAFEWRFEFPQVLDDEGNYIGFDVIVGNPPYIQLQKMGEMTSILQKMAFQTFTRTGDIYCLFYEKAHQLLKQGGICNFITSNKWMRAGYGEATRKFFIENTNPLILIDFTGIKVFDTATVDVNILLYAKEKNTFNTLACIVKDKELKELSLYVKQHTQYTQFQNAESWVILSDIEQRIKAKIEAIGTPLKDWDINIYRGILTGFNDAFIIDGAKRAELIAQDPKSEEIIRPILRGRDIKRYGYDFADLYLINTHNGVKEKGIKRINIEDYPAVKAHLDLFYPQLEKRADQGDTPYNLRNCAYIEDFYKQKIVWKIIGSNINFFVDNKGFFYNNAANILVSKTVSLESLIAFLNSKLYEWYFKKIVFIEVEGGGIQMFNTVMEKIPIPQIPLNKQDEIKNIVSEITTLKEKNIDITSFDKRINDYIKNIFDLEEKEITFIEKF